VLPLAVPEIRALLDPGAGAEQVAVLLQPAGETVPGGEQRLVRHVYECHAALPARDEQARIHEALEHGAAPWPRSRSRGARAG